MVSFQILPFLEYELHKQLLNKLKVTLLLLCELYCYNVMVKLTSVQDTVYIEDITCPHVDTNFNFEYST